MSPRPEQKILRIGVIQGGKIIEERLIKRREDVTVGSAPNNTFVVPASSLPRSFTLFELKGSQYHLAFKDGMDGRVSVGNGVVDFASLKAQNLARKRGDVFTYPLSEQARGKVSLGDVTLLFQFVTPPPEPPKPVLPKEARAGWIKSIDKVFTAILLVSLGLHISGIWVLENTPIPKELSFDAIPDRFAKLIVEEIPEEPPPKPEPAQGEGELAKAKKPEPAEDEGSAEDEGPSEEEIRRKAQNAEVQEKVRNTGILAIIGAKGEGPSAGETLVADILGGGGVGQDLDAALAGVQGVGIATGTDALALKTGLKGGADGKGVGIGDLATKGGAGGKVGTGSRRTPRIRGSIRSGRTMVESSTVDAQSISRYIKVRMRSITSCYEAELKRNPSLQGKLSIRIVIGTNGRVADISIEEDTLGSPAVVRCVRNRIRPWRFPVKPDEETAVTVPFIFAPQS
ncbi:MAG: hypothetical protein D6729_10790 [Deltaproteobacteria bacterium]|nr:MAG: hypothetical protein D6729_10790 [Deltaproteobacteria bacterium]